MVDKQAVPTKLLWVDLEMTGLDPEKDVILEVAAKVTDFDFNILAEYETYVHQPRDLVIDRMQKNIWWADFPQNSYEFISNIEHGKAIPDIEEDLVKLVEQHFGNEPAVLAGNSVHNDRNFIRHWWPALDLKLHYRMLDVSAWKVLMQGKYGVMFEKDEVHRAHDDILSSMAELQHYIDWFKQHK